MVSLPRQPDLTHGASVGSLVMVAECKSVWFIIYTTFLPSATSSKVSILASPSKMDGSDEMVRHESLIGENIPVRDEPLV